MPLLLDKYRPGSFAQLDLHRFVTERLNKMLASGDLPHLLFYGPSGAGKKTRIRALVRELYGPGAQKIKVSVRSVNVTESKKMELTTLSSNYHIELNPSDVGIYDRQIVQEVIKEIAESHSVHQTKVSYKIVVLTEVDKLSHAAQHALRRTMEKYISTCRVILCSESSSRVIAPLRSRCLGIRIPAPTHEEIADILTDISAREKFKPPLPVELATRIAKESDRNLRRAVLMLEACRVEKPEWTSDQKVRVADWERFVDDLGKIICEEQSPQRLLLVRNKMYELLMNCIPPDVLIKSLTIVLLKRLDDQLKHQVIRWAAFYEHRMKTGSKPIFHLEAFVAKFMALYKRWVIDSFG